MADRVHQDYARLRNEIADDDISNRPAVKRLNHLSDVIDSANTLSKEMTMPIHGRDDARLIYEASETYRKTALSDGTMAELSSLAFAKLLSSCLEGGDNISSHTASEGGDNADESQKIPKITSLDDFYNVYYKRSHWAPSIGFLLGPLEIEKKVITRRGGPRTKDVLSEEVQPDKIEGLQDEQQKQTSLLISIAKRLMVLEKEEGAPIPFYQFVLNPWSFSESVENIFYMSFLTRDGKVALLFDENGTPVLTTKVKNLIADKGHGNTNNNQSNSPTESQPQARSTKHKKFTEGLGQIIMDLNMQQWRKLCDLLELTEPTIPSRSNEDTVQPS